jgi:NhaP-type Na+/H+ or K+/H+ antiporter
LVGFAGGWAIMPTPLPEEPLPHRDAMVTITFAVVAFSAFAQGLSITPLLRRLGQLK